MNKNDILTVNERTSNPPHFFIKNLICEFKNKEYINPENLRYE